MAGQAVQACRLLKQMSPDCQLYSLEQSVSKMEDEFKQQLKLLSGKNRDIDIKINEGLAQEYLNAKTQEERDIVMDKLLEDIAGQIPPSLKDKWDSWRYLSMLGNPSEYTKYSVIRGQKSFEAADTLIRTDNYKNKSAEEKKEALEKCYDAAADKAKNEILKGRGIDVAEKEAEKEQPKKKSKSSNKRFR